MSTRPVEPVRRPARVLVVGTSGSGKTTLAREIARRLGVPHIELDSIYHQPGWTPLPDEEFRARVTEATQGDGWVVDGNYEIVRDISWAAADTVVWPDLARWRCTARAVRRTVPRLLLRQELWNGNREDWRLVASKEHPIRWSWDTHPGRRERLAALFDEAGRPDLQLVRLRTPAEVRRWLGSVGRYPSGLRA